MQSWAFLVSVVVALWSPALSFYSYQSQLPNGQNVPHPCKPNFVWHGVGHLNPLGGGDRNQFGQDFARLGHRWSRELCDLDSDHDGLTNGQELGDPHCVWSQGQIPAATHNITHPGVCDPWNSPQCRSANTWVTCDTGEFQCDAIKDPDVRNITLRFPRTKVPAKETTYECFMFDIPADEPYHLIAYTPYIDNPNVMHHIVVFACNGSGTLPDAPSECNMAGMGCSVAIGVWTLGMTGDCIHPDAGFRIGKGAASRLALQFHWTNKGLVDHWYDSSGVTLYYTPRLRTYDAGILITGQMALSIPPGQPSVTAVSTCTSSCTQRFFNGSLSIIAGLNHMHYLGIRGKVEQIRNGHVIRNVTNDEPYSYDNPQMWRYPDPVVVKPGDELKTTCEFSSLSKNRTTFYGPGSFDEMCFGILTFFPAANNLMKSSCTQWRDLDICEFDYHDDDHCEIGEFLNATSLTMQLLLSKVMGSCRYGACQIECPAAIAEARQLSPCLRGQTWEYLKDRTVNQARHVDPQILQLIAVMDSCDRQTDQSATPAPVTASAAQGSPCQHMNHASTGVHAPSSLQTLDAAGTFLQLARELGSKPLLQNIIFNVNN